MKVPQARSAGGEGDVDRLERFLPGGFSLPECLELLVEGPLEGVAQPVQRLPDLFLPLRRDVLQLAEQGGNDPSLPPEPADPHFVGGRRGRCSIQSSPELGLGFLNLLDHAVAKFIGVRG